MALFGMTEEINARDWKTFCERITETARDQLIVIEVIKSDGSRREIARDLPLERMTFKSKDACNNAIWINTSGGLEHEILEPIHLRLKRNPGGGFNSVQIDGETGTTMLHFRPALKPTLMDGFSPM